MDTRKNDIKQDWTDSLRETMAAFDSPIDEALFEAIVGRRRRRTLLTRCLYGAVAIAAAVVAVLLTISYRTADIVTTASRQYAQVRPEPSLVPHLPQQSQSQPTCQSQPGHLWKSNPHAPLVQGRNIVNTSVELPETSGVSDAEAVICENTAMPTPSSESIVFASVDTGLASDFDGCQLKPHRSSWRLSLNASMTPEGSYVNPVVGGSIHHGIAPGMTEKRWHYSIPLSASVRLSRRLCNRLSIEAGVAYTFVRQQYDCLFSSGEVIADKTSYHFIGIPVSLGVRLFDIGPATVYASTGLQLDRSVKTEAQMSSTAGNRVVDTAGRDKPIWMLSADVSAGVGIPLGRRLTLFAEPGVSYCFRPTTPENFVLHHYPFTFNVQAGLKFNL